MRTLTARNARLTGPDGWGRAGWLGCALAGALLLAGCEQGDRPATPSATSATPTADADGWRPLFDGKTLDGWHAHGEPNVWRARDGEIIGELVRESPYAYLVTDERFDDFELELKMRFESEAGNSGVFFRCSFPPQCANSECNYVARELPEDAASFTCPKCGRTEAIPYLERVHIHGPQAEFAPENTGGLYFSGGGGWLNKDALTEEKQRVHRLAEWNDFKLRAVGDHVTVYVNDVLISDVTEPRLPARGIIALQLHAGGRMKVRFKDIRIRPAGKPAGDG